MNKEKRIIKNTIYLYFRMFLTIIINLYATRIILQNIGVIDFGIYNVIAGVIMLFTFFINSLTSSTQRHLSFEMAHENIKAINDTFNVSLRIHIIFSLFIVIIGETIGLYFAKTVLTIPPERMHAAILVYHCIVFIFAIRILSIPYQALINAKEDMHIIALHGILESAGKLAAAYIVVLISFDRLESFGVLLLVITILTSSVFYFYSIWKYKESSISFNKIDTKIYKTISSFAGWTMFGSLSSLIKNQGTTVILNIFLGPAVNAAFGIANQISNQIKNFSSTLLKAVNPQIVMSYGRQNRDEMFKYVNASSKFTFYLFSMISIPLFLEMEFILKIWLKNVPDFTLIFSKLIIINSLIEVLIGPMITAIQATGRIKYYQITSGLTFLLNIPVMYLLLNYNFKPESVIFSNIFFITLVGIIRLYYLKKLLNFSIRYWLKNILLKGLLVLSFSILVTYPFHHFLNYGWIRLFVVALVSLLATFVAILAFGMTENEKNILKILFLNKFKN